MEQETEQKKQSQQDRQQQHLKRSFAAWLKDRFNLDEDRAEQGEVVENIKRGVEFRGTNLWVLIFAIVVASVGLNVNSAAVIIGAMLISPLMGPIMGIGLALGIYDFELFKKSLRNFLYAVIVSLIVSTLYFWISPLSIAQSELLARTSPTIWDVLIATFGGLAGIVAQSRKDRTSTVIPGVAIATALMPPLCTAGFGLASGNWSYFGGAIYLFFINAVFIAFATFFIVRFLKYDRKQHVDPARAKRVKHYMAIIVTATLVPSVILAYGIVQRTIFETSAKQYVERVFNFEGAEVVNSTITYSPHNKGNKIEVVMVGNPVSADAISAAKSQMSLFGIEDAQLTVRQPNSSDALSSAVMESVLKSNTQIIDEKNADIARLEGVVGRYTNDTLPTASIARELHSLWKSVQSVTLSKSQVTNASGKGQGKVVVCVIGVTDGQNVPDTEREKLREWLAIRTATADVKLIIENIDNEN